MTTTIPAPAHTARCAIWDDPELNPFTCDCDPIDPLNPETVMPELEPAVVATVRKLVDINRQIKDLTSEAEDLKTQLRGALPLGDYTVNGRPVLHISPTRKFDPDTAQQVLPPELLALVTTSSVDSKLAKQLLPPALYEQCQKESPKSTVRTA